MYPGVHRPSADGTYNSSHATFPGNRETNHGDLDSPKITLRRSINIILQLFFLLLFFGNSNFAWERERQERLGRLHWRRSLDFFFLFPSYWVAGESASFLTTHSSGRSDRGRG